MIARDATTRPTTSKRVFRGPERAATRLPPVARAHQDALEDLELLEALPGAEHDRLQRRVGDAHGHAGLVAQALIEPSQERPAARQHDPAVHDVGRELGGVRSKVVLIASMMAFTGSSI